MIPPERRAVLWRWREALAGGAVLLLGLWWSVTWLGAISRSIALVIVALGGALVILGAQRGRFRRTEDGPGVVQVVEGRILYFDAHVGGAIDLDEVAALALDFGARPESWVFSRRGAPDVRVPVTARGAEALFDVFSALPGFDAGHMLRVMETPVDRRDALGVVVWRREHGGPALH